MRRNQHVSDSVEHGIDKLHRVAASPVVSWFTLWPLLKVQSKAPRARGVHNVTARKHLSDRAIIGAGHHDKCKCKSGKPHGSACGSQHVGVGPSPYEFYSCTPAAAPPLPPPAPAAPPLQFQYHYHAAFPVPCRPPY